MNSKNRKKKKKRGKVKVQQTDTALAAGVDKQNELQTGREQTKPEVDEEQPGPSAPSVSLQLPALSIQAEESESVNQRDLTDAKGKPCKAVNAATISVPIDDQSSRSVTEVKFLETSLTREERNIMCIFKLIYGVGLRALRKLFMEINPSWSNQPSDAAAFDKGTMHLKKDEEAVFNRGDINEWDFSLMTTVLLYSQSCKLQMNQRPDQPLALRELRNHRNKIIGHPSTEKMREEEFNTMWPILSKNFVTLGVDEGDVAEILHQSDEELSSAEYYKQMFLTDRTKEPQFLKKLESIDNKLDTILANQCHEASFTPPSDPKSPNWDEWIQFLRAVGEFESQQNQYILVADALPPDELEFFSILRGVSWKMVLDFDPMSEEKGLYREFTSKEGQTDLISMITPAELKKYTMNSLLRQIDPKKIQWLFVNGRNSDSEGSSQPFPDWETTSVKHITWLFGGCSDPDKFDKQKPVICLILPFKQTSHPYMEVTLSRLVENFNDYRLNLYDNHDARREISTEIGNHINRLLHQGFNRSLIVEIRHSPGAGGSTIGRRVVWDLHKCYPCALLEISSSHHYFDEDNTLSNKITDRISALEEICGTSPVILIDGHQSSMIEGISNKLVRMLCNNGKRALLLRCQHGLKASNREAMDSSNVHRVFHVNVRLEDSKADLNEFQSKYKEYIDQSLNPQQMANLRRVFHFPLLAMMEEFRPKLQKIIEDTLDEMGGIQQEIALVVAFLQKYANYATPALLLYEALNDYIRVSAEETITYEHIKQLFNEHLLNLMVPTEPVRPKSRSSSLTEKPPECYTLQHPLVADLVLEKVFRAQDCDLFGVVRKFLEFPIYEDERFLPIFEELFLYCKFGKKLKFSVLFEELKVINPERAAEVFKEAAVKTNDAGIFANAARFLAKKKPPSFSEAKGVIHQAFQAKNANPRLRNLYHTKGVILFAEMKDLIKSRKVKDLKKLEELATEVLKAHHEARTFPPTYPHPLIGEVDVWLACIEWIVKNICDDSGDTLQFLTKRGSTAIEALNQENLAYLLKLLEELVLVEKEYRLAFHLMKVCVLVTGPRCYRLEQGIALCEKWQDFSPNDCMPYFYQMVIYFLNILDGKSVEFISKYLMALRLCREKSQSHFRSMQSTLFVGNQGEGMSRLITRNTLFKETDYATDDSEKVSRFWREDSRKKLLECKGRVRVERSTGLPGRNHPYIELMPGNLQLYVGKNADIGKVERNFTSGALVFFVVSFNLHGPVANGITFSSQNP
ncbi:hypothetical protein P5673_004878 [Acropora cervicornis]|uniref:Sterile alpha motif domain-containing protein 9-like n=1 Tax=Acropora cervicornis TaxID=6130 RepID=A0AAD9VD34_ACRCE|nr:hypothetical protein P5673_004878 [Acropora cervicornis]